MSRSQRSCGNFSPHQSSRTALPYRTVCRDWQRHFWRRIDYPAIRFRHIAGIRHHLRRQLHPRGRRTWRVSRWHLDFQFGPDRQLERQQDQLTGFAPRGSPAPRAVPRVGLRWRSGRYGNNSRLRLLPLSHRRFSAPGPVGSTVGRPPIALNSRGTDSSNTRLLAKEFSKRIINKCMTTRLR